MWLFSEETNALQEAIEQRRYATAYALLRRRTEPLSGAEAKACLNAALLCTPGLFRRVLEQCAPGEYCGDTVVELNKDRHAAVYGTMLVLAAALDRPEHVRLLLEAGYDCNSAGASSAKAFWMGGGPCDFDQVSFASPYGNRCGVSANQVTVSRKWNCSIRYATPLAAATACGSRRAAAVLLRWPGVWKEESGVVCRAAALAWEMFQGDPRQAVAGQVFGEPGTLAGARLPETRCLRPEYFADFCSVDTLRIQLEKGFCDEAAARRLLHLLGNPFSGVGPVRDCARKLRLLERYFPRLCRESWVTGILLRHLAQSRSPKCPCSRLIRQWKRLCGEEGDLTWASRELRWMPRKELRALLRELGQDTRLVMDADALGILSGENRGNMTELLRQVHLRYNRGLEGVSALTENLVQTDDSRRFLEAARLGAFQGEDPKELMAYLRRENRIGLRAAALTFRGNDACGEEPLWKTESRDGFWHRCWTPEPAAYDQWMRELVFGELPEEECLRRLQMMGQAKHLQYIFFSYPKIFLRTEDDGKQLYVNMPEAAVFCGTQEQPLRLMMKYMPETLELQYILSFKDSGQDLKGTPLCLAAAMGRTALVKLLLDAGISPNERGRGVVSAVRWRDGGAVQFVSPVTLVTPVTAAILWGREETARLLLDAGAECDFSGPEFQQLLELGGEKPRALAARLFGTGQAPGKNCLEAKGA